MVLLLAASLLGTAHAAPPTDGSANLLLIVADDVGIDGIDAYAEHADAAITPSIDDLATTGVRFDNVWASPICAPTRAGLLTGRFGYRTGVLDVDGSTLDPTEETLAQLLADRGYATALFGKWHLGTTAGHTPTDHGFDHYQGSLRGGLSDYFSWDKVDSDASAGTSVTTTSTRYATSDNVDDAEDWIDAQTGPWFAMLAFNAGHSPFHVPPTRLVSRSTRRALQGSSGDACGAAAADDSATCYRAMVEAMDTEIGRLIAHLDSTGALDDTLVVFVGDNGTPSGVTIDDGVFSSAHAKGTVYQGGVRVPLIVSGVGTPDGTTEDALVQSLDLFATLAEVGGTSPTAVIDAESLYAYLDDSVVPADRSTAYSERFGTGVDRWSVRGRRYKYVEIEGVAACYDLNTDPGESTDVYGSRAASTSKCDALAAKRPCEDTSSCPVTP